MPSNNNPFASIFGAMFGNPFGGAGNPFAAGQDDTIPEVEFTSASDGVNNVKERIASMTKKGKVIAIIVLLLVLAGGYWWFHPALSINNIDLWVVVGAIMVAVFMLLRGVQLSYDKGIGGKEKDAAKAKRFKVISYLPLIVVAIGVIGLLLSMSFFPGNAKKYANILQTENMEFTQDIEEVNYSEIPVIDRSSAVLLGNRTMGTMSDLVSQFEISTLYSQINYNDTPVRVSPLGYADLFKWLQNRSNGIPAYAIVDMTSQDAQIVRLEGDQTIKYSQSEPLARNIDRYVQLKYPFYMFGEKSFEIDEDGHAWWICPVRSFTIGLFGGETVKRAVLVDASTGETQDLAVEDIPEWVDRVYPSELLIQQYNWKGAYTNGWINSWLGQNGVVQTTPGTDNSLGYNYIAIDDDVWMYTGVTSATADNSIVGFVLVNQRTAESHFYSVAGATEESAMGSAEGQVQNLRYEATFPILINVADTPTYFMALKDGAGLVKKYAMVDIERYQNVAVGDTVGETQKTYVALLATNGAIGGDTAPDSIANTSGVIETVATAVIDGNSHFYLTLEGDDHIYDFALPGLVEIVAYVPGDRISFDYIPGDTLCVAQSVSGSKASTDSIAVTEEAPEEGAGEEPATQGAAA